MPENEKGMPMSGYASLAEVREVITRTLQREGRNPEDYDIESIRRDAFYDRGAPYGYGAREESVWRAAVTKHRKPVSLTAFKRKVKVGQTVEVVNNLYPHISGTRTVHKVQTRSLATLPDGKDRPTWTDWPKAALCRIEGNTLHFLHDTAPDRVIFSYTFTFDA